MKFPLFATRLAGNSSLFWKSNGATVLTGIGVAAVPAAMVLTGMATVKLFNALPKIKEHIANTEEKAREEGKDGKAVKQEVAKAQVQMGLQIAKVYSPAIAVGAVSITCLVVSHGMMRKREAQLVGAFVALEAAFKAYRARVAEKIGADEEVALYRNPRVETVDVDGIEACVIDPSETNPSPYSKFFDATSTAWSKDPEYNLMMLRGQQNHANDLLRIKGHLFLNDVYNMLGFQPTQAGQLVGWMADANENGTGDGFIDFGIYQIHDENNRAFVNGLESVVSLDFNIDGLIINKI